MVRVDNEGRYFLDHDKDALSAEKLGDRLRQVREASGDGLRVLIRAEPDANYEAVTVALDRARDAGIKAVSFAQVNAGKSPPPSPSPTASPSKEEIARAMARKREEELARQSPVPPGKPARVESQLPPDEREAYERNLALWMALPPDERKALRGQATERIREETDQAYQGTGLNLNDDQREVFALRYRQERRRLERDIQEKAAAERDRRLPEILERLKREFSAPAAAANKPKPTPKPAASPTPAPSPTPAK